MTSKMPSDLYILDNPLAPLITRSKEDLSRQKSHAASPSTPPVASLSLFILFFLLLLGHFLLRIRRRPLCIPDGKVFCPNKARQRCRSRIAKEV
jgi:hypothetical protein